jgi:hypothetical protein
MNQRDLESILDDELASEPVKAEVQRELEELYGGNTRLEKKRFGANIRHA